MLRLEGEPFTQGRSKFLDKAPGGTEPTSKIFVRVSFHGLDVSQTAQLDTGSAWSVLDPETADLLGVLDGTGEVTRLHTRHGPFQGRLERISVTLLADEGESLDVDATFFVSSEWPGQIFLGYSGLLERIRLAIDPTANHFYFGSSERSS